jgi:hypothetical protein
MPLCFRVAKAASMSRLLLAFRISISCPMADAALCFHAGMPRGQNYLRRIWSRKGIEFVEDQCDKACGRKGTTSSRPRSHDDRYKAIAAPQISFCRCHCSATHAGHLRYRLNSTPAPLRASSHHNLFHSMDGRDANHVVPKDVLTFLLHRPQYSPLRTCD